MAQQLKSINLIAPGFKGLNTEDSPLGQEASYASVADNCIIDRYGRIASRQGLNVLTETKTVLGTAKVEVVHEFEDGSSEANKVLFSCGNNKIMSGKQTLVDETPAAYTITANNWDIVNFNDHCYFFQRGHEPLVYSTAIGDVVKMSAVTGAAGTPPQGNTVLAAWGRLWAADFATDKHTIYWSDLLQGHVWTGGTSGSIDISTVWPTGYDEITAIEQHNNFLVIFGKNSIVIYEGAESPSSMTLYDTIEGVGARCSCGIQNTGTDLIFLAYDGLRSIERVIQQKSLPIMELSRNIKTDLEFLLQQETQPVRTVYSPENNFFLLCLRTSDVILCFDVRGRLENGSYRVTRWPATGWTAFTRASDGTLFVGNGDGVGIHQGYNDNDEMYVMRYYSQNLTFGDSSLLKRLKKIVVTVIGGSDVLARFKWGYDFSGAYSTAVVRFRKAIAAYYDEDEFGIGEFTAGIVFDRRQFNTTGSGSSVVVGMEADIKDAALSLQEFNVWAMTGRLI